MILCSIQPYSFFKELELKGTIRCDGRKAGFLLMDRAQRRRYPDLGQGDFERSYYWMVQQMIDRKIQTDSRYPLWCWQSYGAKNRRPTIRQCRRMSQRRDKPVRIYLNVPDELVLLSNFDTWHNVLQNSYIGHDGWAERVWNKIKNGVEVEKYNAIKEKSWQKIFDLSLITEDYYKVQACIPRMEIDWVTKIDYIF